jgi:hypothetical protein
MEILDNGSNENIFTNTEHVTNIHNDEPVNIKGVDNQSRLKLTKTGQHIDWGDCRINPKGNINLVSFSKIRSEYYIEYDHDDNIFTLTRFSDGTKILFSENDIGLYERVQNTMLAAISNSSKYTRFQIKQAEEARELHKRMSHPGDHALGMLLDNGGILNCRLTSSSLRLAKIIFGECEECRHGKATMPRKMKESDRPRANNPGEILHMDIMFVSTGIKKRLYAYLISIDDYSNHALAYRLPSKNKSHVYSTIKKFIKFYWRYDWKVEKIMTDPEGVFHSLIDDLEDKLKVNLVTSGVNEHEPVCERFIRVLRERIRININTQMYKVPTSLLKYALLKPIGDLNNTPNSKTFKVSPNQIVTGVKVDIKQDVSLPWGTIVDVKISKQSDRDESRIITGIVIGKSSAGRGTRVVHIKNGKLSRPINRRKLWIKNNTDDYVKDINDLGKRELFELRKDKYGKLPELLTAKEYTELKNLSYSQSENEEESGDEDSDSDYEPSENSDISSDGYDPSEYVEEENLTTENESEIDNDSATTRTISTNADNQTIITIETNIDNNTEQSENQTVISQNNMNEDESILLTNESNIDNDNKTTTIVPTTTMTTK